MAPLLSLTEVSHRYVDGWRENVVLDNASLEVEAGDFIGLFGGKRSGKSTLLRIMAGMEQPDSGAVRFDGQRVSELSVRGRARLLRRGGIAVVSSDWHPPLVRPVIELVAAACGSDGTSMAEARSRARHALSGVGIGECAHTAISRLAVSQRLRVCLAMALVREPRLLLVDEPAVLPNPMEGEELYGLLRSLGQERDLTVVIASEDLTPLSGTHRKMVISSGSVRSMDSRGVVLPFPPSLPSGSRVQHGDAS